MREIDIQLRRSRLFTQAQLSGLKSNIPVIIILYFLLWTGGFALGHGLLWLVQSNCDVLYGNDAVRILVRRLIVCGTQISLFFLWIKFIEKRPVRAAGFQAGKPLKSYLTGFFIGIGAITAITVILVLSGAVRLQFYKMGCGYIVLNLLTLAIGWIVQSASEEIAVRGWLIPRLENRSSPVRAVLITAVIFGILHLFNSGVTVLSFLNLTLSGIFFAGYAIISENIWGVCGLHFAWNLALGNIYGFSVSGITDNGISVLSAQQLHSELLTGGKFGPEGGAVTTMLLLVAIGIVIYQWKRVKKSAVR